MQLCGNLSILWHCLSLGLEGKVTFSSPEATAEFSKFAGTLSSALSELKWTGMGEFNSDDHYIYFCGQESLRKNGIAIMVNKRVQNAVLGCNLKNDRMISVHFHGKPFNITVIQAYVPTSNAE